MQTLEQMKEDLAIMRYDRAYNELNLTEKQIVDWEIELELEAAVAFSDHGAGI
jgi:hypothetical protein